MCHNNADLINTQFCLILVGLNMNSNCYMNNNEHCHTVPLLVRIRLVFINVVHSLEDEVAIALFWWGNGFPHRRCFPPDGGAISIWGGGRSSSSWSCTLTPGGGGGGSSEVGRVTLGTVTGQVDEHLPGIV